MADPTPESRSAPEGWLPVERTLADRWPPATWLTGGVVLAVSGGADSMALLRAISALAGPRSETLCVAHFDHRLRPQSTADAEFVRQASHALGLACEVAAWTDPPTAKNGGLEASARQARYAFLRQVAESREARFVATAHTADDQAETILHRILRGTGLRGLAGIRPERPLTSGVNLVRPLLSVPRADLVAYLHGLGQEFRTDETNLDRQRTRNRLRHELLPHLAQQFNPQVATALARLGGLAGDAQQALDDLGGQLLAASLVAKGPHRVELDLGDWASRPRYLVHVALQRLWAEQAWPEQGMNAGHWRRLVGLATCPANAGRLSLPGGLSAAKRRGRLVLDRTAPT